MDDKEGAASSMTLAQIALHAGRRPGATAIVHRRREISYAEFQREIRGFARAVREFGLRRGSVVAVGCDDLYVHWLLLLACEQLGLATASFLSTEPASDALIARVDAILAEPNYPQSGSKPRFVIDSEWCRMASSWGDGGDESTEPPRPEDPVRLIRTSGTTGLPKHVMLTRRVHNLRIAIYVAYARLDERSRFLLTTPFTIGAMYHHAKACVQAGGTVEILSFEGSPGLEHAIAENAITHVVLWPLQLKQVIERLPPDFPKPATLTVTSFGAPLAAALRERALARLATAIFDYYGSNESGFIAYRPLDDDGGPSLLFPGVDVEIVDENHVPLPEGQIGRLRVKSEFMIDRYWDDEQATRAMFRDGWFYPGDLAALHAGRRLQLIGRRDELLNLGGNKVTPEAMEEWVAAHLRARDVGVCTMRNIDGIEELHIALVQPDVAPQEVLQRIAFAFRNVQVGAFYVDLLSEIPRNATGKIERDRLRSAIAAARKHSAGDRAS